jgi:hypothetical protein
MQPRPSSSEDRSAISISLRLQHRHHPIPLHWRVTAMRRPRRLSRTEPLRQISRSSPGSATGDATPLIITSSPYSSHTYGMNGASPAAARGSPTGDVALHSPRIRPAPQDASIVSRYSRQAREDPRPGTPNVMPAFAQLE